ncbi:hypothetical protein HYV85_05670 [Candidatus Woesearchaeota archaeon]|nr:hypothetical protein [Candidatus Woesearchaeota archaeon]
MMYTTYGSQPSRGYSAHPESGLERTIETAYRTAASLPSCQPYLATAINANPYATIYSGRTNSSGSSNKGTAAPLSTLGKDSAESNPAIYHAQPLAFLSPTRPRTPFIAATAKIAEFIKEAFAKTTQKELAEDITITVATREMLQQIHKQFINVGVVGLSLNSLGSSNSGNNGEREIFAVAGNLDEVMLTIGHELGHVLSPPLQSEKVEEAKAFAFEMAWARAIFLHDIAGLRNSINSAALSMKPAQNGLHDLAFAFVKAATMAGKEPLSLHSELSLQQQDFSSEFEDLQQPSLQPIAYVPLTNSSTPSYHSHGYLNKSNVQNVPWLQNFTWTDLGTGIYGMYIPLTASIFMNDRLLRTDLEQFHKTLGHEYILHHVMQLPDNYVTKILEETIFWVDEDKDKYQQ